MKIAAPYLLLASALILEKLALLKIAFCNMQVLSNASWRRASVMPSAVPAARLRMAGSRIFLAWLPPVNARISLEDRETEGTNYTSFYYTLILHK
jgi:hypothetical protein